MDGPKVQLARAVDVGPIDGYERDSDSENGDTASEGPNGTVQTS